jgi:hypothetical protein
VAGLSAGGTTRRGLLQAATLLVLGVVLFSGDITLRSLEAKSARLMILAARQGCAVVNLSTGPSRLVFPRTNQAQLAQIRPAPFDESLTKAALAREAALGYQVPSGRYWEEAHRFDVAEIDQLDALWLRAAKVS